MKKQRKTKEEEEGWMEDMKTNLQMRKRPLRKEGKGGRK